MQNKSKYLVFILSIIISVSVSAQIIPGKYFSYGMTSEGEVFEFYPDGHLLIISNGDSIGGQDTKVNGIEVALKYSEDTTKTPKWIDFITYNRISGDTLMLIKSIYEKVDKYSFDLNLNNRSRIRPTNIVLTSMNVKRLIKIDSVNYGKLLKINEDFPIKGFTPEKEVIQLNDSTKEVRYLYNASIIKSEDFQSKEKQIFNNKGEVVEITFYDSSDNYFYKDGYYKTKMEYNEDGKLILKERYKTENELMDYTGGVFPQLKGTYEGLNLVRKERLINNDSLKYIDASTIIYNYDSYGDFIGEEQYLFNGTEIKDTLKSILTDKLQLWISKYSKYPNTLELSLVGKPSPSSSYSGYEKIPNSEKYKLYTELTLNDSLNNPKQFKGYFEFNYKYDITGISNKTAIKNPNTITETVTNDYKEWIAIWGRELTNAEENERDKGSNMELIKVFDILENALDENEVELDKKTEKAIKKGGKELKKKTK